MKFEKRNINDLIYANYNPRKKLTPDDEEYKKILNSISEFGYVAPIIINSDNTIIGGHQRTTVLKDLGYKDIDVIVIDIDKTKEKALNIALNKISGEWDEELLQKLLKELNESEIDVTLTGFDLSEIEKLELELQDKDVPEDDFDLSMELDNERDPISTKGDLWLLGNHKLLCGDSTNSGDVKKLMQDELCRLIITDPPYNVDYQGKTKDALKIENDSMDDNSFYEFLLNAFNNFYNFAESGAGIYVFHADSEGLNFRKSFKESGFLLKQCLVWEKNTFVLGRQDYQWQHEPILYGWKEGAAHYFIDDRTQTTIVFCEKPTRNDEHPTMKPIKLISKFILNSSKPNWIVGDFFGGSGSTLIACQELQRQARLIEFDEKYCDVIIKRYINWCKNNGQKPDVTLVRENKKQDIDLDIFN